ncbi:MAG: precorrin-6A/cobalt-precorrin-6A reductase [Lachnospiraceae bacterium]|nr:precorrin-6A/cobalt-precorrin-6A reductase [Lachnospiraceae bacterium]
MRIVVFSGTTEGREAAVALLRDGHEVCVSVATDIGEEAFRSNGSRKEAGKVQVIVGRKTLSELTGLVKEYDACLDATHPYALEITKNLKEACKKAGTEYLRLIRESEGMFSSDITFDKNVSDMIRLSDASPASDPAKAAGLNGGSLRITFVSGPSEAAELLRDKESPGSLENGPEVYEQKKPLRSEGKILLTTGVKDLAEYGKIERSRLYARVLPTVQSIEACLSTGISHKNIIGMWGPFSRELNSAMIRQYGIKYLVTKESGKEGGYPEKLKACEDTGCEAIVIKRPREEGMTLDEIRRSLLKTAGSDCR